MDMDFEDDGLSFLHWKCVIDDPISPLFVFQVSWIRKADIHILTMGKIVYTTDKRFSIEHSRASDNWILKLRNAQVEDSGIYECQINTEPKRSKAYLLQVVGKLRLKKFICSLSCTLFIKDV